MGEPIVSIQLILVFYSSKLGNSSTIISGDSKGLFLSWDYNKKIGNYRKLPSDQLFIPNTLVDVKSSILDCYGIIYKNSSQTN